MLEVSEHPHIVPLVDVTMPPGEFYLRATRIKSKEQVALALGEASPGS